MIEVINRQRRVRVSPSTLVSVARGTLEAVGRSGSSLAVALINGRSIRKLNRIFRDKDKQTDVLSFPSGSDHGDHGSSEDKNIGDIAISVDAAILQAERAGHSLKREISELVIHGVLHLCGYDHETDDGEMNRIELRLRTRLLDHNRSRVMASRTIESKRARSHS